MKKLLIILIIVSFSNYLFAQKKLHFNENADTLKHNSIALNISSPLSMILGGIPSTTRNELLYKHYTKKFNYKLAFAFTYNTNPSGYVTGYDSNGNKYKEYFYNDGIIVSMTDTTYEERYNKRKNFLFELNPGIEKSRKTKIGTFLLGAELNFGYYKREETYLYRKYDKTDTINIINYTETTYKLPNSSAPYARGDYLRLGISFTTGFEWKLTKHINVSTTISPLFYTTLKLNSEYYDENEYLQNIDYPNFDFDMRWVNVYVAYKF